jgi:colanic acid biosynthesis glycosyl transferase WcaI
MARVLLVTVVYEPDMVSTARIAAALARGLAKHGHDVTVLSSCPHYNPPSDLNDRRRWGSSALWPIATTREGQVTVVRCYIPRKPSQVVRRVLHFATLHLLMLLATLRIRGREVVIVISPPLTLAFMGVLARRLGTGRLIYNVQELWPDVPRELGVIRNPQLLWLLERLESLIYRSSDHVTAIGPRFAEAVRARGARVGTVSVIPNFVYTAELKPGAKDNALAAEWGLTDTPVVLYAGNIGLTQDFDTLLAAAELLQDDKITVLIVGGGSARATVENAIARFAGSNVLLRDFVEEARVGELYALSDVVVIPMKPGHDQSTTPSKVFSAMAVGRPIVAATSSSTDLAVIVKSARAGLVVPPGEPSELAQAVRALIAADGKDLWDVERAGKVALEHGSDRIIESYDRLVHHLIG